MSNSLFDFGMTVRDYHVLQLKKLHRIAQNWFLLYQPNELRLHAEFHHLIPINNRNIFPCHGPFKESWTTFWSNHCLPPELEFILLWPLRKVSWIGWERAELRRFVARIKCFLSYFVLSSASKLQRVDDKEARSYSTCHVFEGHLYKERVFEKGKL